MHDIRRGQKWLWSFVYEDKKWDEGVQLQGSASAVNDKNARQISLALSNGSTRNSTVEETS